MSNEEKKKVLCEFVEVLTDMIRFMKSHFILRKLENGESKKFLLKGDLKDPEMKMKEIMDKIDSYVNKYDFEEFKHVFNHYQTRMREVFSNYAELKPGYYRLGKEELVAT